MRDNKNVYRKEDKKKEVKKVKGKVWAYLWKRNKRESIETAHGYGVRFNVAFATHTNCRVYF